MNDQQTILLSKSTCQSKLVPVRKLLARYGYLPSVWYTVREVAIKYYRRSLTKVVCKHWRGNKAKYTEWRSGTGPFWKVLTQGAQSGSRSVIFIGNPCHRGIIICCFVILFRLTFCVASFDFWWLTGAGFQAILRPDMRDFWLGFLAWQTLGGPTIKVGVNTAATLKDTFYTTYNSIPVRGQSFLLDNTFFQSPCKFGLVYSFNLKPAL